MLAAGDTPLVSLFGPTAPEKFAPTARRLTVLRAQDFAGATMDAIPVEAVEREINDTLRPQSIDASKV
jgi:ADP-heptose:LPS heptosyltransferase